MKAMLRTSAKIVSQRPFSTSPVQCGFFKKLKSRIILDEDLDKRPSELEIKEKNLPPNTPTLRQRIDRDTVHKFHNRDRHGGYYLGPTGTWRDYVEDDMTLKDVVVDGYKQIKTEFKLLGQEIKDYNPAKELLNMPGKK